MYIINSAGLYSQPMLSPRALHLTMITGQRSRAEMYAKEVLSEVEQGAEGRLNISTETRY